MNDMNWSAISPEVIIAIMACVIALAGVGAKKDGRHTLVYVLSQLTLLAAAVLTLLSFCDSYQVVNNQLQFAKPVVAWGGMVVIDPMSGLLKFCAIVAVMLILCYGRSYAQSRQMLKGEWFTLTLFSLLGAMIMISGNNMVTLYLGLEVMSLSLYALVALRRDHTDATEAAMKYFILGALASGFMLYGMSMVYGGSGGHLEINAIAQALSAQAQESSGIVTVAQQRVLIFGLVFVVAGLAFKLGAVPFHMWVPDVYQGAPTVITLLVSSMPKFAALALAFRMLVEALPIMHTQWSQMLMVLATLSLLVGNFAAIMQNNVKRMLAYSTIAQIGFVLFGLFSGGQGAAAGYQSAVFYLMAYVLTTLVSFGVLLYLSRGDVEFEKLDDLKGLNKRSPLIAGVMAIAMFSLAGIPPLVGFYAKLFVLQSMLSAGYTALAVYAVIMSLIAAFYYLRVVKVMYFDEPLDTVPSAVYGGCEQRCVLSVNGLLVLLFGIFPGFLVNACVIAASAI